jgi:hypothetical protein
MWDGERTVAIRCAACRRVHERVRADSQLLALAYATTGQPVRPSARKLYTCKCRNDDGRRRSYVVTAARFAEVVSRALEADRSEILLGVDL